MKLEIKNSGAGNIQDIDTTGSRILLYASVFDNIDGVNDVVEKGSYKKTIVENAHRIKHLWQHDITKPVGKPESMVEDNKGLLINSLVSKTQLGKDLLILVEDGVMSENSVGIQVVKSARDEQKGLRIIKEVRLAEYSSVTLACNDQATNVAIKSLSPQEQSAKLFADLNLLQKHLRTGNLSDETCALLEVKAMQIQTEITELLEKSLMVKKEPGIISTPELIVEPTEVKAAINVYAEFMKAYKS